MNPKLSLHLRTHSGAPTSLVFFFSFFFFLHTSTLQVLDKPWSQVSPLPPPGSCLQFLSRIGFSNPTARRYFIEWFLTRAPALSASQFVHKKKSPRIYTSMHSEGLELAKLTYTRLEDNLIRHRGDRYCNKLSRFYLTAFRDYQGNRHLVRPQLTVNRALQYEHHTVLTFLPRVVYTESTSYHYGGT